MSAREEKKDEAKRDGKIQLPSSRSSIISDGGYNSVSYFQKDASSIRID